MSWNSLKILHMFETILSLCIDLKKSSLVDINVKGQLVGGWAESMAHDVLE